ncbi:histone-like nucleoid-structuring protein Lsr2 [Glutamicibacter halophytocola]|uniref:histone-like nucleoid-structuring protein Lsr2 n=1 Tax=Glutamicibacter halophytocola TaxID=1933880 RepID=UPI001558657F|nr:Lsr2 family protein [Glutamicibacter halophytocola]NQD39952.1 Lsr2 family protein [Glutamicibacter halophytocola]
MAERIIRIDDIDGTEDAKSYTFALGSDQYKIDLGAENYSALQEALAPFIKAGEKVTGTTRRTSGRNSPEELQKIREWAAANGHEVAPRGRIAASIVDAYNARNAA